MVKLARTVRINFFEFWNVIKNFQQPRKYLIKKDATEFWKEKIVIF